MYVQTLYIYTFILKYIYIYNIHFYVLNEVVLLSVIIHNNGHTNPHIDLNALNYRFHELFSFLFSSNIDSIMYITFGPRMVHMMVRFVPSMYKILI